LTRFARSRRAGKPIGLLAGLLGLALFAWTLREAGVGLVLSGLDRVGAGFLLILAISFTRPLARAAAWRLCLDDRRDLPLGSALAANITGTALGDLTPLGMLLSEPAKAVLVRDRLTLVDSVGALTIENLLYTITVVLMILGGTAAFLVSFPVPDTVRTISLVLLAATLLVAAAAVAIVWRRARVVSGLLGRLARVRSFGTVLGPQLPHVVSVEDHVFAFAARHRDRLIPLALLEISFHVSAIAEVWVTLVLLGLHPTLLGTFVLEYVDRVITVAFKFVPLRLGVDEAGTGLATGILGLGAAPGVALAIVRKARVLVWTGVGVALLMRRGVSVRGVLADATRRPSVERRAENVERRT
jgi:hypothetical protein